MAAEQVGTGGSDGVVFPNTKVGFFGTTPTSKATLAQQTTKTTTQLRAELTALQNELVAKGLITVT